MPILNSTRQLVVVSSYTKYKVSILNGCGDIVDEKCKEKKNTGKTNKRKPILSFTIQFILVNLYAKYEVSFLNNFGDTFDEKVLRNYGRKDGQM